MSLYRPRTAVLSDPCCKLHKLRSRQPETLHHRPNLPTHRIPDGIGNKSHSLPFVKISFCFKNRSSSCELALCAFAVSTRPHKLFLCVIPDFKYYSLHILHDSIYVSTSHRCNLNFYSSKHT